MKIIKISINNYRSIKKIIDFQPLDSSITCFVGPNGSGKSNILGAISALKNDSGLSDEDFIANDSFETITITATIAISEEDKIVLSNKGFEVQNIEEFNVEIIKEPGQSPIKNFKVLNYSDKTDEKMSFKLDKLNGIFEAFIFPDDKTQLKTDIIAKIQEVNSDQDTRTQKITELKNLLTPLKDVDNEFFEKIINIISEIENISGQTLEKLCTEISSNLDIELLGFDAYQIEESASTAGLKTREKHPLLFDLLKLSGKTAEDFEKVTGSQEKRVEEKAANVLTQSINNAWVNHHRSYSIDKQNGSILFFGYNNPQNQFIGLKSLSDGEKWFLRFYTRLAVSEIENKKVIWLFDEPGRDLHANSQINLRNFFENINSQVFYTTHQPMLVPWHRLERLYTVENDRTTGTLIKKRFWTDTEFSSPLREALSTFIGEDLLTGSEHVIVEGISDYFYLQGWLRYFQSNNPDQPLVGNYSVLKRVMVPVDGINQIPLYCWFLGRKSRNKVSWVVVVDSTKEKEEISKKFSDTGMSIWTKKISSVSELSNRKSSELFEIEGVFSKPEYFREFTSFYSSAWPQVKLPTKEEFDIELKKNSDTEFKITKLLTKLLQEKNPSIKPHGKLLEIDKTGIAQNLYMKLAKKDVVFSRETINRFKLILEKINELFNA